MAIYTASFSGVSVTAAQDVFEIAAPATSRVVIREITLGQYSDFGDAQAEMISVSLIRNHGTTGSGGAAVTPVNINGVSGGTTAESTVARNNTTVATNGSNTPATIRTESWNVAGGYRYYPAPGHMPNEHGERPILAASQRFVVRITAPADAITLNGTLVFEEIGKVPLS